MTKQEFLNALETALSGYPKAELEERISFYSEMIDDCIEDGLSEEEAVAKIGSPQAVSEQILKDTPLFKLAKEKIKPKRHLATWEIVLIALGSPIWISLTVSAFAVVLSLYATLWSVLVSLWAVFISLAAAALGCTFGGAVFLFTVSIPVGLAVIGGAIFSVGLSIFSFFGCKAATKGMLKATVKIALWIKRLFLKKEEA